MAEKLTVLISDPWGLGRGGTLTVHVISILFFLVPSPFTSPGLDSGAGIQTDKAETQPEPDQDPQCPSYLAGPF